MDIAERFETLSDGEFLEFDRVTERLSERPDLHAFLLLDKLFPHPGSDMVTSAEHDVIYFDVDGHQADTLTDEQIIELARCGIVYDDEFECLYSFV